MLLAPLLLLGMQSTPMAADYLPLPSGAKYFYEEKSKKTLQSEDWVLASVPYGTANAIPVETRQAGTIVATTFYRASGDTMYIVGYDKGEPIADPSPVFRVPAGTGEVSWDYVRKGKGLAEAIQSQGTAKFGGKRKVLGQDTDVLLVHLEAIVGASAPFELVTQDYVYGKGIGLVESKTKSQIGRRIIESAVKLLKVDGLKSPR